MLENPNQPGGSLTPEQANSVDNVEVTTNDNVEVKSTSQPSMGFEDYDFQDEEDDNDNPLANMDDSWSNALDDDPRISENQNQSVGNNNENNSQNEEEEEESPTDFTIEDILNRNNDSAAVTVDAIADNKSNNESLTIESAVNFLKEKGINIPQQEDADLVRQNSINQISDEIYELNKIINLPENEFLKIAVRNQKANDYRSQGKESLIGSEEFNDDVRDMIDEFGINTAFKDVFIRSHAGSLRDYIRDKDSQLNNLKTEDLKIKEQKIIQINNKRLESLERISKEYGLNLNEAQTAYEFMQSDEYKSIVNDPDFIVQSVVAELARRNGKRLFNNQDNGYARGVSETLEEIKNNGSGRASNSQLGRQMSGTQHLQTSPEEVNPWFAFNSGGVEVNKEKKQTRAAGGF